MFLWNLFIAVLWSSLLEDMSLSSLSIGFVLGFAALGWMRAAVGRPRYAVRVIHILRLVALLSWELLVSNLRVARDVVTPKHRNRPGIIAFTLAGRTEAEIASFSIILSFIPGTLSLDISKDRRTLFLHVMFLRDAAAICDRLKMRIEDPLLEVMRA